MSLLITPVCLLSLCPVTDYKCSGGGGAGDNVTFHIIPGAKSQGLVMNSQSQL